MRTFRAALYLHGSMHLPLLCYGLFSIDLNDYFMSLFLFTLPLLIFPLHISLVCSWVGVYRGICFVVAFVVSVSLFDGGGLLFCCLLRN
jgi:hypothetical protein